MRILIPFSMIVIYLSIPIVLKARDYLYAKGGLAVGPMEDYYFCMLMFVSLITAGYLLNNELFMFLSFPYIFYYALLIIWRAMSWRKRGENGEKK